MFPILIIKSKFSSAQGWPKEQTIEMSSPENCDEHSCLTDSTVSGANNWEDIEKDDDNSNQNCEELKGYSFAQRRKMPNRASKESCLLGIKRRTIMKPSKHSSLKQENFSSIKPANIKKIYLNKKLTNFRPSSLETIFEEMPCNDSNEQSCSRIMSARKIRRIVCFSDGCKYTKTLVNRRRVKIKKTFGKRSALKKISLEEFIAKLNKSMDESGEICNQNNQLKIQKDQIVHKIRDQSQCPDIFSGENHMPNTENFLTNIPSTVPVEFCTDLSEVDTYCPIYKTDVSVHDKKY